MTFGRALSRYRRLTQPMMPLPRNCEVCTYPLRYTDDISIVEGRIPRVVHSCCAQKLR